MKTKLYNLMNWADIEAIVYSEEDRPGEILGPHKVGNSVLYQAFFPDAAKVSLNIKGREKKIPMEIADEEGFFAATANVALDTPYFYEITTKEGKKVKREDPYAYSFDSSKEVEEKLQKGILYDSWEYFGGIKKEKHEKTGVSFMVRVPNAQRVSLVGEFSQWDGRWYPMNRLEGTELFSLFYPDFDESQGYLYEVKNKDGSTYLMKDPYSLVKKQGERELSFVYGREEYSWSDEKFVQKEIKKEDCSIYSWDGKEKKNEKFFSSLKKCGFTHILLPGFSMDNYFYQFPSFFECDDEFKEFVNMAHKQELGVIFKWNASGCENLQEKENSNFYLSNILFLIQEFHLDGILFSGLEKLFYLDYEKGDNQWIPNIYGGNENLEGIELVKHAVSILRRDHSHLLLLAALDALWWGITEELSKGGLGFDYCVDTAFARGILSYLRASKEERVGLHHCLSQRMDYIKEQNFIMAFEQENLGSLWEEIKESEEDKFNLLKTMTAYISFLPGKAIQGIPFPEAYENEVQQLQKKCHDMKLKFLSMGEKEEDNFFFLNKEQREQGVISFWKMNKEEEGSFLVIANFSNEKKENYLVGVPLEGKYEAIFDTQIKAFGGKQLMMSEKVQTKEIGWDGFPYQAAFSMEPYSLKVFLYSSFNEEEILEMARKRAEEIKLQLEQEAREKIARLRERKNKLESGNN